MSTSAPGKLMLFGEHAVVYGYPCIATAISERLVVTPGNTNNTFTDTRFMDAAIKKWGKKGLQISAKSGFSGTYGFGSSSAVTVATLKMLKPGADNRTLFDAAYEITLKIQGAGSGFDVAIAVFGGTLYYVKPGKIIEPLATPGIPLIVGYTGEKSNTVDMINVVAQKRSTYPERVERIFQGVAKIVDDAKAKMIEGDWERVGRLMDFNQEYLRDLGISSEKLETLIGAAKKAGAWGAKLSGAGGGDCMIALASPDTRLLVEDAITKAGGEVVHITANAPGVRVETTDNQDELFIVVDRDDNILEYRTRWECHHDSALIHRTVGALIYNDKGNILLQKRSITKDMDPGLWQIASAGHVLKGQSREEAVHRELQEELGVDVPLTFVTKFLTRNENESEITAIYRGTHNGPFRPDTKEVAEVKFFDPREVRLRAVSGSMRLTSAARDCLTKVGVL